MCFTEKTKRVMRTTVGRKPTNVLTVVVLEVGICSPFPSFLEYGYITNGLVIGKTFPFPRK